MADDYIYNLMSSSKSILSPQHKWFYRFYPHEATFQSAALSKQFNKGSLYVLSVWQDDQKLGQISQVIKFIPLGDKFLISKSFINFQYLLCDKQLTLRLSQYFGNRIVEIAEGVLDLSIISNNYMDNFQRHFPEFKCSLNLTFGAMNLVCEVFFEANLFELEGYIKRFKLNQSQIRTKGLRKSPTPKRNSRQFMNPIDSPLLQPIKEENSCLTKQQDKEQNASEFHINHAIFQDGYQERNQPDGVKAEVQPIEKLSEEDGDAEIENTQRPSKEKRKEDSQNQGSSDSKLSYNLQINSAFKLNHKFKKVSNQSSSNIEMEPSRNDLFVSNVVLSISKSIGNYGPSEMRKSAVSDGSEYQEMLQNNASEGYSKKAVNAFKKKVRICTNILFILIAILLVYAVLMPDSSYQKMQATTKSKKRQKPKN